MDGRRELTDFLSQRQAVQSLVRQLLNVVGHIITQKMKILLTNALPTTISPEISLNMVSNKDFVSRRQMMELLKHGLRENIAYTRKVQLKTNLLHFFK